MTSVLLALRFALELALLAVFALGGWRIADGVAPQWILAIVLPVACAVVWGLLIAPKARIDAPLAIRLLVELALFAVAAGLLWVADLRAFALVLLVGEVVVLGALLASGQRPGREQLPPAPTASSG